MKILYLDLGMGAAGDMLAGALADLLPAGSNPAAMVEALGIPDAEISFERIERSGICGGYFRVLVDGKSEDSVCKRHEHSSASGHHHHGDERHMEDIERIVAGLSACDEIKFEIMEVYKLIAEAESRAHGVEVTDVHFSEVGRTDAIADIAAVCLFMRELAPDKIIASPVRTGSGTVMCAHGTVPVPAPATLNLLEGIPAYAGDIAEEMCTPTGAALIRHFASDFAPMPLMRINSCGYGMGTKDFGTANCLRAIIGETFGACTEGEDFVCELSCNVDDMTGEEAAFALERIMEAGALDVYIGQIIMKKSRPGLLISVLCRTCDREKIGAEIFKHTSTIGIRSQLIRRLIMERSFESREYDGFSLRLKSSEGFGSRREKYEFGNLAKLAKERNISLGEARRLADEVFREES